MTRRALRYNWVIVGGGPQGLALAGALIRSGTCQHHELLIIDGGPSPLWAWRNRATNCGMRMLRSDVRFHLDCWPEKIPYTLEEWARQMNIHNQVFVLDEEAGHLVASTSLFNSHCDWFLKQYGLEQLWYQDKVIGIEQTTNEMGWTVLTTNSLTLNTKNLVLAIGQQNLNYPGWSRMLSPVYHLLDLSQSPTDWSGFQHITVVGGGLSSANFALKLAEQSGRPKITLLLRNSLRSSILEADLATLEKPFQSLFQSSDYATRRKLIQNSRQSGTIPPQTLKRLQLANIEILNNRVRNARKHQYINLELESGQELETEAIVLGTGFVGGCKDGLVTQLIQKVQPRLSEDGYPIPSPSLEWLPGLFLLGGLAELELGPICRNLAGAAQGVARIMQAVRN